MQSHDLPTRIPCMTEHTRFLVLTNLHFELEHTHGHAWYD
jgi:hypothetical protein